MTDGVTGRGEALVSWGRGADLCAPFVEFVPVAGGSISMFGSGGTHSTVSASDPLASRLDEMQLMLGEGPRWEAVHTGRAVLSPDIVRENNPRWPTFGERATGLGVSALFTFPIIIGGVMIGAVDLYRTTPGPLGADETSRARSLTRMVAAPAVARAVLSAHQHNSVEHTGAPALRREVHQATGMILIQLDVTADDALALLKAHAFVQGRAINEVASDVVNRRLDFRDLAH